MVFGSKQIVRVGSEGKVQWSHKWKWDRFKVALVLKYVGQNILYCVDWTFAYIDGTTGQTKWMGKEKADAFFLLPGNKLVIAIEGKEIRAYPL